MLTALQRPTSRQLLLGISALACALNVAYALTRGPERFFAEGYGLYADMGQSLLDGRGFCLDHGDGCAVRVPVYPLIVALILKAGSLYPALSLLQAVVTAAWPIVIYAIATRVVERPAAMLAALMTAVNPYTVIHSTALQDTAIFNVLAALGVLAVIKAHETGRARWALAAGATLAVATLTSSRFVLFPVCAIAWLALSSVHQRRQALLVALPVVILLGGWGLRNSRVVGEPMLTSETGMSLWVGNNASTFMFLPDRSIDENMGYSRAQLPPDRAQLLEAADEATANRLMAGWALEYARAHPFQVGVNMVRKVFIAFSGRLSPAREGLIQLASLVYIPIHLLAVLGLWRLRGAGTAQVPIYLLMAAFAITTALSWAHTSHTSYLEPFLFMYAASVVTAAMPRRESAASASRSPAS